MMEWKDDRIGGGERMKWQREGRVEGWNGGVMGKEMGERRRW